MSRVKNIVFYLFLAFTIPLVCIMLMKVCPIFHSGTGNLIAFGIEGASPAISVWIIWAVKRRGIKEGIKKSYVDHFSLRYCLLAVLLPFVILTIAKIVIVLLVPGQSFINMVTGKKLLIIAWALIAEELGWRGFLKKELEKHVPVIIVPLMVGVIWACWHYHFMLSGSMEVPLAAFALGCVFESYGYYSITKLSRGNIVPASIWHFTGNLFFNLYRFDPSWNQGNTLMYWITTGAYFMAVIWFLVLYHNKRFCIEDR